MGATKVQAQSCTGSDYRCYDFGTGGNCNLNSAHTESCSLMNPPTSCYYNPDCCAFGLNSCTYSGSGPTPTPGGGGGSTVPWNLWVYRVIHHRDGTINTSLAGVTNRTVWSYQWDETGSSSNGSCEAWAVNMEPDRTHVIEGDNCIDIRLWVEPVNISKLSYPQSIPFYSL